MWNVHVNPDEAVQAHLDLRSRRSIVMHFCTFKLTTEGIYEPNESHEAERVAHGVQAEAFRAPEFGELISL